MLCLTRAEETIYNELFIGRAPNLAPGLYYIRDFSYIIQASLASPDVFTKMFLLEGSII